jgi:Gly-Xaa carboxypeptidase
MGEKGYLDLSIAVATAGGHSSVPPTHTGIGIMSAILAELESNPFETKVCTLKGQLIS